MSYHNGPRIVTNGLVLYLDAGSSKSYPGSGTTWTDLSGNNNNGTLINGPTYSSGNKGSIVFDGINDGCTVTNNSSINPFTSITFGSFFYITSFGSNYAPIIFKQNNYTSLYEQYSLYLTTTEIGAVVTGVNRSQRIARLTGDFRNMHIHAMATCDTTSGLLSFYVNGNLIQSVSFTGVFDISTNNLRIGFMDQFYLGFVAGRIFNVSIYNRALTGNEIFQNYNTLKGRYNL